MSLQPRGAMEFSLLFSRQPPNTNFSSSHKDKSRFENLCTKPAHEWMGLFVRGNPIEEKEKEGKENGFCIIICCTP